MAWPMTRARLLAVALVSLAPLAPSSALGTPNTIAGTISLGDSNPGFFSATDRNNRLYFTGRATNRLFVVDAATDSVAAAIPVGLNPLHACPAPDGTIVYVVNNGSSGAPAGSVSIVDVATRTVRQTIAIGKRPTDCDISADGRFLYVTNNLDNTLSVVGLTLSSETVLATVPLGRNPQFPIVDSVLGKVYVANFSDSTVTIVDMATNRVAATVDVGLGPIHPASLQFPRHLYVTNRGSNSVSVIDLDTNNLIATIPVGAAPGDLRIAQDRAKAYVANSNSASVSVLDLRTNTVVKTIPAGTSTGPISTGVRLRTRFFGTRGVITNESDNSVTVYDTVTDSVLATLTAGSGLRDIRFSAEGSKAYVVSGDGTVTVIRLFDVNPPTPAPVAFIPVVEAPQFPRLTGDGTRLVVPHASANTLALIDTTTNTVVARPAVGLGSSTPSGDFLNRLVYAPIAGTTAAPGNTVAVVDTGTGQVVKTLTVGRQPVQAELPPGDFAYVLNRADGTISVIDVRSNAVAGTLPVGRNPAHIQWSSRLDLLAIPNTDDNTVTFINQRTNAVTGSVPVGRRPTFAAFQSGLRRAYITNGDDNTVSVIDVDALRVVTTIPVGANPIRVSTSDLGDIYVSNYDAGSISIIDPLKNQVIKTLAVGARPRLSFGPAPNIAHHGGRVGAVNEGDNTVSIIDFLKRLVIATIPVGRLPQRGAHSLDGTKLYVASQDENRVDVVDLLGTLQPAATPSPTPTPTPRPTPTPIPIPVATIAPPPQVTPRDIALVDASAPLFTGRSVAGEATQAVNQIVARTDTVVTQDVGTGVTSFAVANQRFSTFVIGVAQAVPSGLTREQTAPAVTLDPPTGTATITSAAGIQVTVMGAPPDLAAFLQMLGAAPALGTPGATVAQVSPGQFLLSTTSPGIQLSTRVGLELVRGGGSPGFSIDADGAGIITYANGDRQQVFSLFANVADFLATARAYPGVDQATANLDGTVTVTAGPRTIRVRPDLSVRASPAGSKRFLLDESGAPTFDLGDGRRQRFTILP